MSAINRVEVYACPNGHFERDKRRALAWHLSALVKEKTGHDYLQFSGALALLEDRERVIELLRQDEADGD
jgi:hypothetical protein